MRVTRKYRALLPALPLLIAASAAWSAPARPKPTAPPKPAAQPTGSTSDALMNPAAMPSGGTDDWPTFRGNTRHTALVPVKVNLPLKSLWTWKGAATSVVSSPAISGSTVYIGTRDDADGTGKAGSLIALDLATGKLKWRYNRADAAHTINMRGSRTSVPVDPKQDPDAVGGVDSSPAVVGNMVYFTSRDGSLQAVTTDGKLKWRIRTGGGDKSSPAVANGAIYFGSGWPNVDFWAVDAASGVVKWRTKSGLADPLLHRFGQYVYASPAFLDGIVYGSANDGGFYALDATTGKLKWRYETSGGMYMHSPTIAGDIIVGAPGDYDTAVYGITRTNGDLAWKYESGLDHSYVSSGAYDGSVVYLCIGEPDQQLVALDAKTGKLKWKQPIGMAPRATYSSSPAITNNLVFVGTAKQKRTDPESGRLIALDKVTGSVVWQANLPAEVVSSPAVVGHYVVVGCSDGSVNAYTWSD